MEMVIKIPEEEYKRWQEVGEMDAVILRDALVNGKPLPKGHGRLIDIDKFLKRVEGDRKHECYLHSWTIDDVLQRLDSWYAPIIIEADKAESEG